MYTVFAMAKPKPPQDRPPAKDKVVNFRVSDSDYELADVKAKERGSTVGKIMRALFWMWAHGEGVPPEKDWPPELEGENIRAEKRPRKPRKK